VAAVKNTEARNGDNGVSWIGGSKAGGNGQTPIQVTTDVVCAGYNLLHNRSVDDSSSISSSIFLWSLTTACSEVEGQHNTDQWTSECQDLSEIRALGRGTY
jgi:hypothetical protein